MKWTELSFGKYEGKTLPQVLFCDPDWFFWAMDEDVFKGWRSLREEATVLDFRAKHIRILPGTDGEPNEAEYYLDPTTKKLGDVKIVPSSRPEHPGSSQTWRLPVLDFSFS